MKKYGIYILIFLSFSCKNDDDDGIIAVPLRDRKEESIVAQADIEEYLETHFYNYEEFENPPKNFDFRIKFDTIAGDNLDKIPLINQVDSKKVKDRVENDLEYTFYFLKVNGGGGDSIKFPDIAYISYEGMELDETLPFDSNIVPIELDLTQVVDGFQETVIEFRGAEDISTNTDGSLSFQNFGIGAAFIPSGLGYFGNPPTNSGISLYAQTVFKFYLYESKEGDQDADGVLSIFEDRNGNFIEEDDDTDGDGVPNFRDTDDDGDGRPTAEEIEIDSDGNVTYPDVDGDGTPDYLDSDS